jgi:hypothetical protein
LSSFLFASFVGPNYFFVFNGTLFGGKYIFRQQIPNDMWRELKADGLLTKEVPVRNDKETS